MFQTTDIKDTIEEVVMIKELRSLAEKNKENFNITFYHPFFPYIGKKHALKKYDQFAHLNTSCFWGNTTGYTKFLLQQ